MEESVKKEFEKNINEINSNLNLVLNTEDLTDELIKLTFNGIRILVEYCEKLVFEGEDAIEMI
jgi:hypothetical protein